MSNANIFNLLGIHKSENLHSRFIVSLLEYDPKIKKAFINMLNEILANKKLEYKIPVDLDCKAMTEHTLRNGNGRVDIYITDRYYNKKGEAGYTRIIIENKIFAGDQENQLLKYSMHLNDPEKKYIGFLFYLTLEGKSASRYSTGDEEFVYYNISYYELIHLWLNKINSPKLKKYIKDYKEIVKKLTRLSKMIIIGFEEAKDKYKGISEDDFNAFLELKFWQYIEDELKMGEEEIKKERLYSYDKIRKSHKTKIEQRNYGIIVGNKRLFVKNKELYFSEGKFKGESWDSILDKKLGSTDGYYRTDNLVNIEKMKEIAKSVIEIFYNNEK